MDKKKTTTKRKRAVKSVALVQRKAGVPATQAVPDESPLGRIVALAKDPTVDVGKINAIVDLQLKMMAIQAKADFEAAFHAMHPKLPIITKHGVITGKADDSGRPTQRGRYGRLGEDIQPYVNPVLTEFNFTLRHKTDYPKPGIIRTIGILTHLSGHSETSEFEAEADTTGGKAAIQARRSSGSYGRRATTIDVLNLVQQDADDDGEGTRRNEKERKTPPPTRDADVGSNPDGGKPITDGQRDRLWQAIKAAGREPREVQMWVAARFGVNDSKDIKRKDFEYIVKCIEHPGKLPLLAQGEPAHG